MTVVLKCISKPINDDIPNSEALLAYFARVSSTANQLNHATGAKLIKSLINRQEWSPLEMVSMTIEINTTRDISRQILRHRSFSFQEFSQRYAEVQEPFVYREARIQDIKDRQNSFENDDIDREDAWHDIQYQIQIQVRSLYNKALSIGIAKEQARAILPEGMTPTKLYMAGTLRSWIHYCILRCDKKTQKEHRDIACKIRDIIIEQFPSLAEIAA